MDIRICPALYCRHMQLYVSNFRWSRIFGCSKNIGGCGTTSIRCYFVYKEIKLENNSNGLKNITIKKMGSDDLDHVVNIWYEASIQSHDFISDNYWQDNKKVMKDKYLPASEAYLAVQGEIILGFIVLADCYLAALFIKPEMQSKGIGSLLLDYAKNIRHALHLKVYKKNNKSVKFYQNKGFTILSKSIDRETGETELVMKWNK